MTGGRRRGRAAVTALVGLLGLLGVVAGCGSAPTDDLPGAQERGGDTTSASRAPAPTSTVAGGEAVDAAPALPVTVESADGRAVTVDDVSRIVPLEGNLAEIVFDLGLGDHVVGRDVTATFPEAAHLPVVTRAHDVSAESVLSLRPTLVLADDETGPPEAIDHIRNVGVPVVVIERPTSLGDVAPRIEAVAAALGLPESGVALARQTSAAIDDARTAVPDGEPAPRVAFLYFRGTAGVYLIGGPGSGADSMIVAAGGEDAGTAMGLDRAFTPITSESMVMAAPDVILMTTTGLESVGGVDGLVEIAGIAQTPAGRDRRVATVEDGLLYSFGARTPEAIETLVDQLYGTGG
jgi:iron complex transport system substrate-binding protein